MNSINLTLKLLISYITPQLHQSGGGDRSVINIDMDRFTDFVVRVSDFKERWSKSFKSYDRYRDRMPCTDKMKSYDEYIEFKKDITEWLNDASIESAESEKESIFGMDIMNRMENIDSNHGRIFFDPIGSRPMTLYEHTLDALFGICSGTGISLLDDEYLNKLMIITTIYHDSGKLECKGHDHDEISCRIVKDETSLMENEKSLIRNALIDKNLFYNRHVTIEQSIENVKSAFEEHEEKYGLSKNVSFRFVFSLFLADSTTLFMVYNKNKSQLDDYHKNINSLIIESDLEPIIELFNK
jgi:hypothetical protein